MAVESKQFAGTDKKFFTINKVAGINTQDPRFSIKDEQFAWLENIQPISDGNFVALADCSNAALYTTTSPRTIVYAFPFNIGSTNYIGAFLDDGTAVAVNIAGGTSTISSTAGGFYPGNPSLGTPLPQCVQYGQNQLVIVSTGLNGYSIWDGTLFYTSGTLAPTITITNPGTAYQSAPSVVISGGRGSGATGVATINNGSVSAITLMSPGSGYQLGDIPKVTLVGGQLTGSGASFTAVMTTATSGSGATLTPSFNMSVFGGGSFIDQLVSIAITTGGSSYSSNTTATWNSAFIPGFWVNGGVPSINLTISGGIITSVGFTPAPSNPNAYFNNQNNGDPTITVTDQAANQFFVSSVTVVASGTNYSPSAVITVTTGTSSPLNQAAVTPVITTGGHINSVTIVNQGVYGSASPPTLTAVDTAVTATATVLLMPFGMFGTCVETYQSRVWVGNGATISFSAPSSSSDFTTIDGAGSFSSTDGFLRREYTALKQSNGFLYVFGDSSVNVISNVQTSGSPLVTTFNNQNVEPQIGTPWHNSAIAVEDFVIFANIQGVFKLAGSNVTKVSDDLDGIFINANSTLVGDSHLKEPSAALMTLNDKQVYLLTMPVAGPFDNNVLRTAMVMWDGKKWWIGSQRFIMTQVSTQEFNSTLQAWGISNNSTKIFKLFSHADTLNNKIWQTKIWSAEGPYTVKQLMRLYSMITSPTAFTVSGTYDALLENTALTQHAFTITPTGATTQFLVGYGSTNANVRGNYVGMTMQTTDAQFTLVGHWLLYQEQSPMP